MKKLIVLMTSAAMAAVMTAPVAANDRYRQKPPVVVSPDLSAPWVIQVDPQTGKKVKRRAQAQAQYPVQRQQQRRVNRQKATGIFALFLGNQQEEPRQKRRAAPQPGLVTVLPPEPVQTAALAAPRRKEIRPQLDPKFLPQEVAYDGVGKAGDIVIDGNSKFLYLIQSDGTARRYGVGVGKEGFEWKGTEKITDKKPWPTWRPPAEMIARERANGRILPAVMEGGEANPLGARALYLGDTLYRIHGTNAPWTIGTNVSSGCIRMRNEDVIDLYERVGVGTKVIVL